MEAVIRMIRELIPSMFHRRLLLLGGLLAAAGLPLVVQMGRLTLARGVELRGKAESKLQIERPLPSRRGTVFDRKGRVLAVDAPAYDIAVDYEVIKGGWVFRQAAEAAQRELGAKWRELNSVEQLAAAEERVPFYAARLDRAWELFTQAAGITQQELEAKRNLVVRQVSVAAAYVTEAERLRRQFDEEALARSQALAVEVSTSEIQRATAEQKQPHVLLRGVSDDIAFRFQSLMAPAEPGKKTRADAGEEFIPGLRVVDSSVRDYPLDSQLVTIDRTSFPGPLRTPTPLVARVEGVTMQIVGAMRKQYTSESIEARKAELTSQGLTSGRLDRGAYRAGDPAGRSGIELSAEFELRGLRGSQTQQLDTGELLRVDPVPGVDVTLTLDVSLQARIQALLEPASGLAVVQPFHDNKAGQNIGPGTTLAAAVVVLDIDTAEVLAMVSTPTVTRARAAAEAEELNADLVAAALVNKCINRAYPPGSIVKPLMLCAAATAGAVTADIQIACPGHLYPEQPNKFQCWIQKQFRSTHNAQFGHDLNGSDAIMGSCNIFFYTLGRSMGPQRMIDWYRNFGVGDGAVHARLGIGAQYAGVVGDEKGASSTSVSESTLMGIGQGPIAWTPLHAADAFSTIARRGQRVLPRLRKNVAPQSIDLRLDQRAVDMALDGLRRAVGDDRGTGNHISWNNESGIQQRELTFNAPGITVWGKSGTADAPAVLMTEIDDDGRTTTVKGPDGKAIKLRDGDHAWLVCLAGGAAEGRPRYAIAVVVEFGGSGGKVAGPIANQVIHALMAEGYL